jgi:hypothetical protein
VKHFVKANIKSYGLAEQSIIEDDIPILKVENDRSVKYHNKNIKRDELIIPGSCNIKDTSLNNVVIFKMQKTKFEHYHL